MTTPADFAVFFENRPAVIVVSHERSGTHFLMNSLAACYGYVSDPWLNFDLPLDVNFFYPPSLREYLLDVASAPLATIVKSHHAADFFGAEVAGITKRYVIFVIYRDPVSVLLSFWRFLHAWPWFEGPKVNDPIAFARAQPCGAMMRYQRQQYPDMMCRWAAHVEGWLEAARHWKRVVLVRYEDLDGRYEDVMRGFATVLEHEPIALVRPEKGVGGVPGGPEDPSGRRRTPDKESLRRLCRETVGDIMSRLGY